MSTLSSSGLFAQHVVPDTHTHTPVLFRRSDASDVCLMTTWIISWRTIRVTQVALYDIYERSSRKQSLRFLIREVNFYAL